MPQDDLEKRLALFANGGQLEIQNPGEGYICRGEIKSVNVTGKKPVDRVLTVEFTWLTKHNDKTSGWDTDSRLHYEVSLFGASTSAQAGERFMIRTTMAIGETLVFFPKNHHSAVKFREEHSPKPE